VFITEKPGYGSGQFNIGGVFPKKCRNPASWNLPANFINILRPGGGGFVLAITFTFIYSED
jgi:hypothetical protein